MGIFFLLDLVSFNIPFFASVRPSFFLMVIFYWSIFRPTMIPGWMVFCAGIFYDLISGIPVGLNGLLYFLVRISITEQRKVFSGQSFAVVYLGYVAVAVIFFIAQWLLFSLVNWGLVSFYPLFGSLILSIVFFPPVFLMMNLIHKLLPHDHSTMKGKSLSSSRKIKQK